MNDIEKLKLLLKEVTQCLADANFMLGDYYERESVRPDEYFDHRKLMIKTACEAIDMELPLSELTGHERLKRMLENVNQLLKNTAYEGKVEIDGLTLYFREDTDEDDDNNWTNYCTIQEDLGKYGLALYDAQVEHDCISGTIVYLKDSA